MRALSSGTDCEAGDTASLAMARKGKAKGSGSQTLAAVATVLRKGSVTNGGERTVQGRGEGGRKKERNPSATHFSTPARYHEHAGHNMHST